MPAERKDQYSRLWIEVSRNLVFSVICSSTLCGLAGVDLPVRAPFTERSVD